MMKMFLVVLSLFLGSVYAQDAEQVLKFKKDNLVFSVTIQHDNVIEVKNGKLLGYDVAYNDDNEISYIIFNYTSPKTYESVNTRVYLIKDDGSYSENKTDNNSNIILDLIQYLGTVEGLGKR